MNFKHIIRQKNQPLFYDLVMLTLFVLMGIIGRTILVGFGLQPFPNFEIIMVLTFLAALFIRPTFAFLVPLGSMIGSDLLIGNQIFIGSQMNKIVLFTYTGFLMISIIATITRKKSKSTLEDFSGTQMVTIIGMGVGFVLLYDLWTNFGWWYLMFPHTPETFISVYLAGIPFMLYHMLSATVTFTLIAIPVGYLILNKNYQSVKTSWTSFEKIPILVITLLFISLSFSGSAMKVPHHTEIWLEDSKDTSISISVQGSDWQLKDNIVVSEEITVLEALNILMKRHNIIVTSEYYETFQSTLIQKIHTDENGADDKYWQYYVNGELPMVGCDAAFVYNGDVITWSFEEVPS